MSWSYRVPPETGGGPESTDSAHARRRGTRWQAVRHDGGHHTE